MPLNRPCGWKSGKGCGSTDWERKTRTQDLCPKCLAKRPIKIKVAIKLKQLQMLKMQIEEARREI